MFFEKLTYFCIVLLFFIFMKKLLEKLNYKDQQRIALLNADNKFSIRFAATLKNITIDTEIDPRFPYSFIMIFVKNTAEVDQVAYAVIHNLSDDGILWFCFPRKTSKKLTTDLSKDFGWKLLNDSGFYKRRLITVNTDWSALSFKHEKHIKKNR